jgi:hypothetical protein
VESKLELETSSCVQHFLSQARGTSMMSGWVKEFSDHSYEIGGDEDASASWSRGKLENMIGAGILHNSQYLAIRGTGEYWQSDSYESSSSTGETKLISRRIEKKIESGERLICISKSDKSLTVEVVNLLKDSSPAICAPWIDVLSLECEGLWLVVEYNIENERVGWFVNKERL